MQDAVAAVEAAERRKHDPGDDEGVEIDPSATAAAEEAAAKAAASPKEQDAANAKAASEDAPPANAAEALIAAKNELEAVLKKAQQDTQELKDKWLRAAADLENYKKRATREREDLVKFANERMLKDLLPLLDDLDRTIEAAATTSDPAVGGLLEGVKLIQKKFLTQLEKFGVTAFDAVGQAFDPNQHEAVQQVDSDTVPAGGVAVQMRRGFMLNGRLLRPAMVAVSLGPKTESRE